MLIILSGIDTINKKLIAHAITTTLNTFEIDGYRVDTSKESWELIDNNGNVVYGNVDGKYVNSIMLGEQGEENKEGIATVYKLEALKNQLQRETEKCHYFHQFGRVAGDWNLIPTRTIEVISEEKRTIDGELVTIDYQYVLNQYLNRITDTQVISGIFSKVFIDKMKNDIGSENVLVLNIIRNPSAAYLMAKRPIGYYDQPGQASDEVSELQQLRRSIFICCSLIRFSEFSTIKFENIITTCSITVNGIEIKLPKFIYKNYNDYITNWEFENSVPLKLSNEIEINSINDSYQHITTDLPIDPNPIPDFFIALGYKPLTYQEIIT